MTNAQRDDLPATAEGSEPELTEQLRAMWAFYRALARQGWPPARQTIRYHGRGMPQ
jgi:hypothetical protein